MGETLLSTLHRRFPRVDRIGAWSMAVLCCALVSCEGQEGRPVSSAAVSSAAGESSDQPRESSDPATSEVRLTSTQTSASFWEPNTAARDWKYIVIHHSATESGSVESIHRTHLKRRDAAGNPWRGIGYHFIIGNGRGMDDGAIEPTFRWREQLAGAHAGDQQYNHQGIGICLVGNFEKHRPTAAQLEALSRLIGQLTREYHIPEKAIVRHSDIKPTRCPGKMFPMQDILPN